MACWYILKVLLALLVLGYPIFRSAQALDASEEVALREILQHHPDLYSVPSWETLSSDIYYGSSWNDSISSLCQNDGYDFFGVYCRGGHVFGLRVYVIFIFYTAAEFE